MKKSEIKSLSLEDAKAKLEEIYNHPLIDMYLAITKQLKSVSRQIYDIEINISDEEGTELDVFFKMMEKGVKFAETIKVILSEIDAEQLADAKELKEDDIESIILKNK